MDLSKIKIQSKEFTAIKQFIFAFQSELEKAVDRGEADYLWVITYDYKLEVNNAYVSESQIAGNGVFARRDLEAGDIITIYPADLAYVDDNKSEEKKTLMNERLFNTYFYNQEVNATALFERTKNWVKEYALRLSDEIIISGCPRFTNNPSYIGHIVNDSQRITDSSQIESYEANKSETSNATFIIHNNIAFVVATKSIKQDEEVLAPYGTAYWLN